MGRLAVFSPASSVAKQTKNMPVANNVRDFRNVSSMADLGGA
jgi:hypothetical protein